ncbi:hypothetical protein [Streptomyces shaanxiensis]
MPLIADCVPSLLAVFEGPLRGTQGPVEVGSEERLLQLFRHRRQLGFFGRGDGSAGLGEFLLQFVTASAQPGQENLGLFRLARARRSSR